MLASAPGSTGKNMPVCFSASFSAVRVMPGCTTARKFSGWMLSTRFIRETSRLSTGPCSGTGTSDPSRLVPAPKGITATCCSRHHASAARTSSTDSAKATASGGRTSGKFSSRPCASSTDALSLTFSSPSSALSVATADVVVMRALPVSQISGGVRSSRGWTLRALLEPHWPSLHGQLGQLLLSAFDFCRPSMSARSNGLRQKELGSSEYGLLLVKGSVANDRVLLRLEEHHVSYAAEVSASSLWRNVRPTALRVLREHMFKVDRIFIVG